MDNGYNNMGPNNMGPNNMGPNNMGPNNMGPNNMGPNNMGPNNMGPNMNGYNQNMPVTSAPEFTKYLILSIAEMICCCQITGIIGIVFIVMANSAFKIGNIAEYQSKVKNTKTTLIIGLVVGIVCNLLIMAVYGLSFMMGILSEI